MGSQADDKDCVQGSQHVSLRGKNGAGIAHKHEASKIGHCPAQEARDHSWQTQSRPLSKQRTAALRVNLAFG